VDVIGQRGRLGGGLKEPDGGKKIAINTTCRPSQGRRGSTHSEGRRQRIVSPPVARRCSEDLRQSHGVHACCWLSLPVLSCAASRYVPVATSHGCQHCAHSHTLPASIALYCVCVSVCVRRRKYTALSDKAQHAARWSFGSDG
jgi:hypothetical protein